MKPNDTRIIVGMSGGVDSSVAAHLLLQQGYKVEGLFMKNWEEDDNEDYCAAAQDLEDAKGVCDNLGIKLHSINFSCEYWDNVFEYFLQEYKSGRTPNPDIMCNKEIKFKAFLDYALDLGADFIATGHYAQNQFQDGSHQLQRGLDSNKDQSYFLYTLNQNQLAKTMFPIGKLEKSLVRAIASDQGFTNHNKKDSTGICFIGERKFKDFLSQYIPAQPGNIVSDTGKIMGKHKGLMFHTIGQRKGLGIGGLVDAPEDAWFVLGKNMEANELIVGQGHNHPLLLKTSLVASQLHWVKGHAPREITQCTAKIRYRQLDETCQLRFIADDKIEVNFLNPVRAITPGQSIVFYQERVCLGGGIID